MQASNNRSEPESCRFIWITLNQLLTGGWRCILYICMDPVQWLLSMIFGGGGVRRATLEIAIIHDRYLKGNRKDWRHNADL